MKASPLGPVTAAGLLVLALLAGVLSSGCRSANPGLSNRMASIIVTNRPAKDLETAIRTVFEQHGYEEGRSENDELVFEKKASFMSGVVYSDWYSGGVWERIKIYQRELDSDRTIVECDGYMVKEHEDPLFATEKKEYQTKRGHCQGLLDKVALELAGKPKKQAKPVE